MNFKSLIFITLSLVISSETMYAATPQSVCGTEDRLISNERAVGRLRNKKKGYLFCSATLIGRSCVITAGHCGPVHQVMGFDIEVVENRFRWASKENTFEVDKESKKYSGGGKGDDWAVFRLKANRKTKLHAGDTRPFLNVQFEPPEIGTQIKVIGYGGAENLYSFSQQEGPGELVGIFPTYVTHTADTKGGSSGAPIIDPATNGVFGIHTHGNCKEATNSGTLISGIPEFVEAIRECLDWESENLD
ncbi:trypsin-like serine protease [bacterium]|nr:trypsin-like serine protease [bacterium]